MVEAKIESYEELAALVDQNQEIVPVMMGNLRDMHGAGKLGVNVVSEISRRLADRGLSSSPSTLPTGQWQLVLIYRRDGQVAKLIDAITKIDDGSAEVIRSFILKKTSADEILGKIKDLVCE